MPESFREFLQTRGGTIAVGVAFVLVMALAASSLVNNFGTSEAGARSRDRLFICSETGKTFRHAIEVGEPIPVRSPYSGRNTGFEAELCRWTADGRAKQEPTPALLNAYVDKPGPTFCPDCDRLVIRWNPGPYADQPPPPTRQEMQNAPRAVQAAGTIGDE